MEHPLAIAARVSSNPNELYERAFAYFQNLFSLRPGIDMAEVELPGYLPDVIYEDRSQLNPVITGALFAMLEQRSRIEGDSRDPREGIALSAIPDYVRFCSIATGDVDVEKSPDRELLAQRRRGSRDSRGAVVVVKNVQPPWIKRLDDIICSQGGICGQDLLESELVRNRVRYWERCDYPKYERFLHGLDRFAKMQHRCAKGPNKDPLRRCHRDEAVKQLRIAVRKMKAKFLERKVERDLREAEQAIIALAEEIANDPGVTFLSDNRDRWLEFVRFDFQVKNLIMNGSAELLYNEFVAFVKNKESPDHVRRTTSQS
jgi:hypothetical protein